MIVKDQVKTIKEYLLAKERDTQKEGPALDVADYDERLTTIENIRSTMRDVVKYCFDDGWKQDEVCELIFKVCFGEEWDADLDWYVA